MSIKDLMVKAVAISAVTAAASLADVVEGYTWDALGSVEFPNQITLPVNTPANQDGYHSNPSWQMLGTTWGGESDGILWSVNGGEFSNDIAEVVAGDKIQFKFDLYKPLWGRHTYEAIRVWVNGETITTYSGSLENLTVDSTWYFNYGGYYRDYYDIVKENSEWGTNVSFNEWAKYYANQHKFFYSDIITATDDLNVVARVLCSADIARSNKNSDTHYPYADYDWKNIKISGRVGDGTGEKEIRNITVNQNVPEPATLSLLGFSLLGLAFFRKKSSK